VRTVPGNGCDVVVVGASAGGVEALRAFARALPPDFGAAVLIVLHVPATGASALPQILTRDGPLTAIHATDGEPLVPGRIFVAPPNNHLLVNGGRVELTRGPRENGHRPAIDPLFRSAAAAYDSRVAGVVLSGTLDDGTAGLYEIKRRGGATLVQDPDEALYPAMPSSAIAFVDPDHVLPTTELVDVLVRLTASTNDLQGTEGQMPDQAPNPSVEDAQPGHRAPFSCPDCGGTLWSTQNGDLESYRCRVGHAFTENALVGRHEDVVDRALWTAYRALEERAAMSHRLARRLGERGRAESALRFLRQAQESSRHAEELRRVLNAIEAPAEVEEPQAG